ncbi:MAG: DNA polymerase III subunit epsilon [Pseudomonadota bacterium]
MREIIFDTETTGVDPQSGDRVVEIGALEMRAGAVTGRTFHTYVNPERDMPEGAFRVHGLSTEFLSDKPVFSDPAVVDGFIEFVGDAALVAHNAAFDVRFMNAELTRLGRPALSNKIVDTLAIAKRKFPGSPASLDALCARFGIDTSIRERDGHGALLDSELLASVYVELTGGAQAGLSFDAGADDTDSATGLRRAARSRPQPLAPRGDVAEAEAHAAFVAELGENALWLKVGSP